MRTWRVLPLLLGPPLGVAVMFLHSLDVSAQAAAGRQNPKSEVGTGATTGPVTVTIASRALGQTRKALLSFPASYARTSRRYPTIVVLDGEANFNSATTVATTLAELGHIPESIIVAIPNASGDPDGRVRDMTPPGLSVSGSSRNEGGDRFLDFIEKELLPEVAAKYRGGAPHVLIGHSSGGVIATYAAATRTAFPIVVSIDAPVHLDDEWLAKRLIARARQTNAPPLRYVSLEARFGWLERSWLELRAAAPRGWILHREKLDGETHETMPFLAMYQGLKSAFSDFSIAGAPIPPRASAMAAFDHYHAFERQFDTRLPPPPPVLRQLVEDLLTEGQVEPARHALGWLVEGFGEQGDRAALEAMIANVAARPPLEETVAQLKATPPPTAAEIAPYVGLWRGHSRLNENTEWALTVRVRTEDGKAVMEHLSPTKDGGREWLRYEYVKLVPDGVEFGTMNGMRPLGMNVLTGRRTGDVLEGTEQFRGIVLPLPDGHMPPTLSFRLEREPR